MRDTNKPTAKKPAANHKGAKPSAHQDKRRILTERLQKIRDGSEVLTAELERLRQRLTPRT